jgi:putative nucleotidyltransferase with HDIG domain
MSISSPIQRILKRIAELPTLPTVLEQILEMTAADDTSAQDLVEILSTDQSLTANLLRVANSPVYGVPYRIQSVKQAVVLLGFNEVRGIAVGATVFSNLRGIKDSAFDREAFWRHCFLVAHLTRELYPLSPAPEAKPLYYTAGLLHDVGVVVLDQFFQEEFTAIIEAVKQDKLEPREAENRFLGADHQEIGAMLLRRWQLPEPLVQVVAAHHTPWEAKELRPLAAALFFANFIAQLLEYPAYVGLPAPELEAIYEGDSAAALAEAGLLLDRAAIENVVAKYRDDRVLLDLIMGSASGL